MKKSKVIILITILLLGFVTTDFARDYPQANFGKYGIKHYAKIAVYKRIYVGQVVQYIPQKDGGNYGDKEYFQRAGGKFNTDYVVSKISGNDEKMTWVLVEKGTKNKVKMYINNLPYGEYYYHITDTYSIPLFLSERFNVDNQKYIGKVYPENPNDQVKLEVTDFCFQNQTDDYKYPQICLVLENQVDGKKFMFDFANISYINDLGKVFTNPKFKCSYAVVNVLKKSSYDVLSNRNIDQLYYTVQNSIDGMTKDVKAESARKDAFKDDDSGKFFATLTQVEKPSNPSIRYGKTTTDTEEGITKFSYQDNFIDVIIFASESAFFFTLKNVSDNTLKVVWNEAVFVDVDGFTSKVMHSGIKYSQKESDQLASIVIRGAKLEDSAVPIDKVYYSDNEWTTKSLYSKAKPELSDQNIKLMLPIQVMDVVNEYIFEFTLTYRYNHPEYIAD